MGGTIKTRYPKRMVPNNPAVQGLDDAFALMRMSHFYVAKPSGRLSLLAITWLRRMPEKPDKSGASVSLVHCDGRQTIASSVFIIFTSHMPKKKRLADRLSRTLLPVLSLGENVF